MTPLLARSDIANGSASYAIISSYAPMSALIGADCQHISLGEFGKEISLPVDKAIASFGVHIGHIDGLSTQEQMIGIDAKANVALVQNAQSFWDRAIRNHPRQPMGADSCHCAVSMSDRAACPDDTAALVGRGAMECQPFGRSHAMANTLPGPFSHAHRLSRIGAFDKLWRDHSRAIKGEPI